VVAKVTSTLTPQIIAFFVFAAMAVTVGIAWGINWAQGVRHTFTIHNRIMQADLDDEPEES